MRSDLLATTLVLAAALAGCETSEAPPTDTPADTEVVETDVPQSDEIELSPALCSDPSLLQRVTDAFEQGGDAGTGGSLSMNVDELPKLLSSPTEPFYMVNLITFRERAEYADGRQTDLTGREANALYDPLPLITQIGGRVVYSSRVDQQIDGDDDIVWEDIGIVGYPCPIAFLAMAGSEAFQATSIHKDAGVEVTRVMFTELQPLSPPDDPSQASAAFPPTGDDPAFDLMHVMDFHDVAQYEPDANEPGRTGQEAWERYQSATQGASDDLGHHPTASFKVRGTLIGTPTGWDEISMVRMSSQAGFQALLDDETRADGEYHRDAALADNDSMILYPMLSAIPYSDGSSGTAFEVTPDGTGTLCQTDDDCPGDGLICLGDGSGGFCTVQDCASDGCEGSYLCCHDVTHQRRWGAA
jgi:hypothetical protein